MIGPLKFAYTPDDISDAMLAQFKEIIEGPIEPFKKWFTSNFDLPVKTVEWF